MKIINKSLYILIFFLFTKEVFPNDNKKIIEHNHEIHLTDNNKSDKSNISLANRENDHTDDHIKLFHSFIIDVDIGIAKDGNSRGFDISGWIGGDYNKLWIKSEKKNYGNFEEKFEFQLLYSRNIARFWDGQIGISHDFSTDFTSKNVNYLTIGLEGLAPQSFETEAQIFLSEKGNLSLRLRQEVDIFITQYLIMQPYFETEIFANSAKDLEIIKGISDFELGLMTRYEISRKFAPYFSLRYHTKTFGTAKLAKKINERIDNAIISAGLRLRF